MDWTMRLRHVCATVVALICVAVSSGASAVTIEIGDSDSFGFTDLSSLVNANGDPVDADGNGRLNAGDALPDLNENFALATFSGDDFDNRSASESGDSNAQWTDVSLSTSQDDPGVFRDVSFSMSFSPPTSGDPLFGVDHFLNFLVGDRAEGSGSVSVDGDSFGFTTFTEADLPDGGITATSVPVPFENLTDGTLNIEISGTDPYVAIDSVLLDAEQTEPGAEEPTGVPAPGTLLLFTLGVAGLGFGCRRR